MSAWSRIGCATIIVGCSAAQPRVNSVASKADAAVAPALSLCDGSDEFRLLVNDEKYEPALQHLRTFEYPHNAYLAIDGHCHYIATWDFMLGIRAGDLTDRDLSSLDSDLSLARLASLPSTRSQCKDGSTELISTLDANLSARCPEFEDSTETGRALVNAEQWEMRWRKVQQAWPWLGANARVVGAGICELRRPTTVLGPHKKGASWCFSPRVRAAGARRPWAA
jgi:hypothetical protein